MGTYTLRLRYNTVLYNADSIITMHNANCEIRTPCVFPSLVWQPLIFPRAVSTCHSIYNAYVVGDHDCVIKRRLGNFCLQNKTAAGRGNVKQKLHNL